MKEQKTVGADWLRPNIRSIELSSIRQVTERAKKLGGVINLGQGEPGFDTPEPIREAAKDALDAGFTHYTPTPGLPELRQAVARYLQADIGVETSPNEVLITMGAAEGLYLAMVGVLEEGDEVLVSDPGYLAYGQCARMLGARVVQVPTYPEDGFSLRADEVRRHTGPRTKMIILNSPCNPTGGVIEPSEVEAIAHLAVEEDLFVVSDEVYHHLLYNGAVHRSMASFPELRGRLLLLDSFSKSFAMTGWRIGYVYGSPDLITPLANLHQRICLCINGVTQKAAMYALENEDGWIADMVARYAERRELAASMLNNMKGVKCPKPAGAFYLFPDISGTGMSSEEFVEFALEKARVGVIPGSAFGSMGEGYVRVSYAASTENIREGLRRLAEALERTKNHA